MFFDLHYSNRLLEEKLQLYRREAEKYRLEQKLDVRRMGPSVTIKMEMVLIGIIFLVVAAQIVIA